MAMQRIEDMDSMDIESLVSVLLKEYPKTPAGQYLIPQLGDSDALWDMSSANKPSGKTGINRG